MIQVCGRFTHACGLDRDNSNDVCVTQIEKELLLKLLKNIVTNQVKQVKVYRVKAARERSGVGW